MRGLHYVGLQYVGAKSFIFNCLERNAYRDEWILIKPVFVCHFKWAPISSWLMMKNLWNDTRSWLNKGEFSSNQDALNYSKLVPLASAFKEDLFHCQCQCTSVLTAKAMVLDNLFLMHCAWSWSWIFWEEGQDCSGDLKSGGTLDIWYSISI